VALPRGLNLRRVWKQLIRAYDPDRVVPLGRTFRGQFLGHDLQEAREAELRRRTTIYARQHGLDFEVAAVLVEQDQDRPYDPTGVDDNLIEWLKEACAPLEEIRQPWLTLGTAPSYEFNDLLTWDLSDLPPLQLLRLPIRSKYLDLLVASQVGDIDAAFWQSESDRGATPILHDVADEDIELLLNFCWFGTFDERAMHLRHGMEEAEGLPPQADPSWFSDAFRVNTPLQRSLIGCTWLYPRFGGNWNERPLVVVVGDTSADFCLFQMARHLFTGAIWMPHAWAVGTNRISVAARRAVVSAAGDFGGREDRQLMLTSASVSETSLHRLAPKLMGYWRHDPWWKVAVPEAIPEIDLVPYVAEAEMWETTRWAPFFGEIQGDQIDTPIPDVIRMRAGQTASWHVDVSIDGHHYPVRAALAPAISAAQSPMDAHNIKPSNAGVSYWTEGAFRFAGQALRHSVIRPRLRTPPPIEVFNRLLARRAHACRYSDKGHYTSNAIRLWGGLDQLADDLSTPWRLTALLAFLSQNDSGIDPGVKLQRRRYLTFWDIQRAAGANRESLREWLDELLDKGILTRGLIAQCDNCLYSGWYPATRVGRTFDCDRCRTRQVLRAGNWKKPTEPMWFYELAEVVFQALNSDCRDVVLALSEIKKESRRGFHYEPQMELFESGRLVSEVDIWAISNGRVVLGEAKSTNRLGRDENEERKEATKLLTATQACGADNALFASTSKQGWRTQTHQIVDEVFAGSGVAVEWLTRLGV
jgi:hypothetical protein